MPAAVCGAAGLFVGQLGQYQLSACVSSSCVWTWVTLLPLCQPKGRREQLPLVLTMKVFCRRSFLPFFTLYSELGPILILKNH